MSRSPVLFRRKTMCGCFSLLLVWSLPLAVVSIAQGQSDPANQTRDCSCSTTVTTYPYTEDFESGFGLWENVDGDDFDWERIQGATPSDNTGPNNDHTFGDDSGHYLFTESSGDNYPDKTAILDGPCFDLSSLADPELALWYHMAGDSMGTMYIEISDDGCANWDVVFEMHEHQGYDWKFTAIDLTDYSGQTIAVRVRGRTADGYESDMAVDDIYVGEAVEYDGGCCDLNTGLCLGVMTEAECLTYGNVAWYLVSDCSEENFCPQPPPANDLCVDATLIDSLPYTEETIDWGWATSDVPVSCDADECENAAHGIWYTYTPIADCGARVRLDVHNGGSNTFIAAFTGPDCDNLVEHFCSNEQESSTWQEVTFNMYAGETYWVLIGSFWCSGRPETLIDVTFDCSLGACCTGETCSLMTATDCDSVEGYYFGDDTICEPDACLYGACCTNNGCESLTAYDCDVADGDFKGNGVPCELDTCPPANETCNTAESVTNGSPAAEGSTRLATEDDDEEASCEESTERDLWYAYTATCTGTVHVDTEGSQIWDTTLSVWDYCGGEEFGCEKYGPGPNGDLAALDFEAISGETYYIRFAPLFGIRGEFQINISCEEGSQGACCFGDSCTIDYRLTCEAAGGFYGGDDTICAGDDCNSNGVEDMCDFLTGASDDCNDNKVPDECDLADGTSDDLDANTVPDECDPDCNDNGIHDGCDVTCDGGCGTIAGCGQSNDCQGDIVPDECQLEDEGCDGARVDTGYGDLIDGVRPDYGWANYGIADDFTMEEDSEGSCFRFDIYDFVDSGNMPEMQVRIYENFDGLMDIGYFGTSIPVFEETYSLEDGTLEIIDSGEDLFGYDLLHFMASGTDWHLDEGDYAIHLTFPQTTDAGFWASAGTDDSDCSIIWGDWWGWPSENCDNDVNLTRLSFALLGPADNDCNGNGVPDECDIEDGLSEDNNDNEIPDECEDFEDADLNHDDNVDLDDFSILADCLTGPDGGILDGCDEADIDEDGDVDLQDFADFSMTLGEQ